MQKKLDITTSFLVLPRHVYNIAQGLTGLTTHFARTAHQGLTVNPFLIMFSGGRLSFPNSTSYYTLSITNTILAIISQQHPVNDTSEYLVACSRKPFPQEFHWLSNHFNTNANGLTVSSQVFLGAACMSLDVSMSLGMANSIPTTAYMSLT